VSTFLYPGESNPATVKLSDPTVLRGGGVNAEATPAGVSAALAVGSAVSTGGAAIEPVGVSAGADVGTPGASGAAQVSPVGVEVVSAVGTVDATAAAVVEPSGVAAVASVGDPAATGGARALPDGVSMVAAIGVAVATGDTGTGDATAYPAGVEATVAVGAAAATGDALAEPHGVELVSAVGTAVASTDAVVVAPPVAVSGGYGGGSIRIGPVKAKKRLVRVDATAYPRGVEMLVAVGQAVASGSANVSPRAPSALSVSVSRAQARDTRNLTWEQIAVLAEAA